jgi:hypothetical protein
MTYQEYDIRLKIGLDNGTITEVADIINLALENYDIKVKDLQISGNDESLSQRPLKEGEQ